MSYLSKEIDNHIYLYFYGEKALFKASKIDFSTFTSTNDKNVLNQPIRTNIEAYSFYYFEMKQRFISPPLYGLENFKKWFHEYYLLSENNKGVEVKNIIENYIIELKSMRTKEVIYSKNIAVIKLKINPPHKELNTFIEYLEKTLLQF